MPEGWPPLPAVVAFANVLDLDHIGTQIGQDAGAVWACNAVADLDNSNASKW